ncbi:hypothetical protein [Sphingomonas sp. VNH70]|uniref:hypothetical protein n=1 Tax=Sphingomonas silueang TaxID=3156617 RepID=UPI0032B598FA
MKRILMIAVPLAVIVVATITAYVLIGNPKPANPRRPTPYATTPIDTPTRDPLARQEARLAHMLAPPPQDGLRFVAVPQGGQADYAFQIAVHALGAPAKAILIVTPHDGGRPQRHRFNVPRQEESAFFRVIDAVLPRLPRGDTAAGGGTPAALERIGGGGSRTWTTTLPDADWAVIDTAIRDLIARHAPAGALPNGADWVRQRPIR